MRALPLLLLAACTAPDVTELFNQVEVVVAADATELNARFAAVADEADTTLRVALPGITDAMVADALSDAAARGVAVDLVVDVDSDASLLPQLRDAGVAVTQADGDITYFEFTLNAPVSWPSSDAQMTHAFAVADRTRFVMASHAGDLAAGSRVAFDGRSEDLGEDLVAEHIQVFGGTDATATTAFDAPAKSVTDARWAYPTQSDEILEVWFGPQERPIKRIIDATYGAMASVRVITEDFADEGFARALQAKAADGFEVEVIVGQSFGTTNPAISDILRTQTPDVVVLQATSAEPLPTVAFFDLGRARDNRFHMPRAMVLTHPVWSAARLFNSVEVVTDQLCDSTLTVIGNQGPPGQPILDLTEIYTNARATAVELR